MSINFKEKFEQAKIKTKELYETGKTKVVKFANDNPHVIQVSLFVGFLAGTYVKGYFDGIEGLKADLQSTFDELNEYNENYNNFLNAFDDLNPKPGETYSIAKNNDGSVRVNHLYTQDYKAK